MDLLSQLTAKVYNSKILPAAEMVFGNEPHALVATLLKMRQERWIWQCFSLAC
jgi:hypothetical protein